MLAQKRKVTDEKKKQNWNKDESLKFVHKNVCVYGNLPLGERFRAFGYTQREAGTASIPVVQRQITICNKEVGQGKKAEEKWQRLFVKYQAAFMEFDKDWREIEHNRFLEWAEDQEKHIYLNDESLMDELVTIMEGLRNQAKSGYGEKEEGNYPIQCCGGKEKEKEAAYDRYSTIYAYAYYKPENQLGEIQGPHTLAHVSVNFLMKEAPSDYDWWQQIPSFDELAEMLEDEMGLEGSKYERYKKDYISYYADLKNTGGQLNLKDHGEQIRKLMEMHPMGTYGWISNMKKSGSAKSASKQSTQTKGEREGPKMFLDGNWKNTFRGYQNEMKAFLKMRLSMVVNNPELLEEKIAALMKCGQVTLSGF